jgi:hypothetical protein
MQSLFNQHDIPLVERSDEIRVKIFEMIEILGGDLQKYEFQPTGGCFIAMPPNTRGRNAIRHFLAQVGLVSTGETMSNTYADAGYLPFVERFILGREVPDHE